MNPVDHPHGGGRKSKGGKAARSPWGWLTKGPKTVKRKKWFVVVIGFMVIIGKKKIKLTVFIRFCSWSFCSHVSCAISDRWQLHSTSKSLSLF